MVSTCPKGVCVIAPGKGAGDAIRAGLSVSLIHRTAPTRETASAITWCAALITVAAQAPYRGCGTGTLAILCDTLVEACVPAPWCPDSSDGDEVGATRTVPSTVAGRDFSPAPYASGVTA